jgi:predicted PurR-regulated permease PerM
VIEPQAMGNSLNLSPWVILVALTIWGSLWGLSGAVFSVPITAVMVVVFSEFASTRPLAVLLSKDGSVGGAPGVAAR